VLLGEFGEERRNLTPIAEIPAVMKNAVLAIEDSRFYSHSGVDYKGLMRAGIANLGRAKSQGASTITMQVARNVYLSSEKTFTRKLYEVLLTFKLEHLLTKDQILEIYMNQIFLGNRAYGFAAACETYFGKPLKDITIAEAAMLAGLPKAPFGLQTGHQSVARPFPPAVHHRADGGERLHHGRGGPERQEAGTARAHRHPDHRRARRVHRRDRTPAGLCASTATRPIPAA
jgi:membrane peptidoglycan carboxypeptidase